MKHTLTLLTMAAASLTTACTTTSTTRTDPRRNLYIAQYNNGVTPYLPLQRDDLSILRGGYTTTEIQPGLYLVGFLGNGATPMTTVEDSVKYRAAEVALRNGYKYFVILYRNHGQPSEQLGSHYVVYGIACHNDYLSNDFIDAAQLLNVIGTAYKSS